LGVIVKARHCLIPRLIAFTGHAIGGDHLVTIKQHVVVCDLLHVIVVGYSQVVDQILGFYQHLCFAKQRFPPTPFNKNAVLW